MQSGQIQRSVSGLQIRSVSLYMGSPRKKYRGILKEVNGNNFTVTAEEKVKVEGKKRPELQQVDHAFEMDKVKYTKYLISFK